MIILSYIHQASPNTSETCHFSLFSYHPVLKNIIEDFESFGENLDFFEVKNWLKLSWAKKNMAHKVWPRQT